MLRESRPNWHIGKNWRKVSGPEDGKKGDEASGSLWRQWQDNGYGRPVPSRLRVAGSATEVATGPPSPPVSGDPMR